MEPCPYPADPARRRAFSSALGYLELGLDDEAEKELLALGTDDRTPIQVLGLWLVLWQKRANWKKAAALGAQLSRLDPESPNWRIAHAYAVRRSQTLEEANRILLEAARSFPDTPIIEYNLACYACRLNQLETARQRLRRALALDKDYLCIARKDEDLAVLRLELEGLTADGVE